MSESTAKLPQTKHPFPAITVGRYGGGTRALVGFNKHCAPLLEGVQAVRVSLTPNYVVLTPASRGSDKAISLRFRREGRLAQINMPVLMQMVKVKPGARKLLRYKDGFAFSRYETLE